GRYEHYSPAVQNGPDGGASSAAGCIRQQAFGGHGYNRAMAIRREFLDWRQPALISAAEVLRGRFEHDSELDLGGVIVVVPSGRAGRRLLEILVAVAEERQLVLTPPEIVTPEGFPELLYL